MFRSFMCLSFLCLSTTILFAVESDDPRTDPQLSIKHAVSLLLDHDDPVAFFKSVYTPAALEPLHEGRTIEEVVGALEPRRLQNIKERAHLWLTAIESKPTFNEAKNEATFPDVVTECDQSSLTLIKVEGKWFVDLDRSKQLRCISPGRLHLLKIQDSLETTAWGFDLFRLANFAF